LDINLNTLKREILDYLERSEFAVFHSTAGGLENLPMVLWDLERVPDYRPFLEAARKAGATMILFAAREFTSADVDELVERLGECELERDERRDMESRLRDMRAYEGETCSLELAFDHHSRFYVYDLRPDWYDDFLEIEDDIAAHEVGGEIEDEGGLGGYFSRN